MFAQILAISSLAVLASAQVPPNANPVTLRPGINNGYCLEALGQVNFAAVSVLPCTGAANQQWTFQNGAVSIFGNKCLDVTNGNDVDGAPLQLYDCTTGDTNQQWYYTGDERLVRL
jgi:hypothetical protein